MKTLNIFAILFLILFAFSCNNDDIPVEDNLPKLFTINGYVQKGPYINGTSITIAELRENLAQTGKNFSAQILDNKGTFNLGDIELNSQFVELKANGFYFDEVRNENSVAQLTLFALSDVNEKSNMNVNLLSSLEKSRVNYLVNNGKSFSEAKRLAQKEILAIFEIEKNEIANSEWLDISKAGDDNAILLAISVIMQGYLPVSDLSELLANISSDIHEDGVLNNKALGTILINNAKAIKLNKIRSNLENRYKYLSMDAIIPDFEKYVNQFIDNTEFEFTGGIKYPETGGHGFNILDKNKTEYTSGTYSMKAILPEGSNLRVKIMGKYNWMYPAIQDNTGWSRSDWNDVEYSRIFTSTRTGEIDFEIMFSYNENDGSSSQIEILVFENEDVEPTWTKTIKLIIQKSKSSNYFLLLKKTEIAVVPNVNM